MWVWCGVVWCGYVVWGHVGPDVALVLCGCGVGLTRVGLG